MRFALRAVAALVVVAGSFFITLWFLPPQQSVLPPQQSVLVSIVNYDPKKITRGIIPNAQPGPIWLATNSRVAADSKIQIGDIVLPAAVNDKVIAATLPKELYDKNGATGSMKVRIIGPDGQPRSEDVTLNIVKE